MAEVFSNFTVRGRTYLRDEETGQFLSAVHGGAQAAVAELTNTLADLVSAAISAEFNRRTGELEGSVTPVVTGQGEGQVIVEADHAAPLHQGAVAHWIPNAFGRGPDYKVWHPGNVRTPFVEQAEKAMIALAGNIIRRNMPNA